MGIKYVIMAIVAVCLALAAYEMRDDFKREIIRTLARLGIGCTEQRGDVEYYRLILPSRRTLALFLLLALVAWVIIVARWA